MLNAGDHVMITYKGRTVCGTVLFISNNKVSAALSFEALLGGYPGMMPIVWKGAGYVDLIEGEEVTIASV